MNVLSKMAILLVLALTQYREASSQPSDILRLRHLMLEEQSKKSFARDTAYIDILDSLAYGYYRISVDSVFFYAKKAVAYAKEAGYGKGESVSLRLIGNGYGLTGDYVNMLSSYQQALAIAERINNPVCIAKATINIAIMYDMDMEELRTDVDFSAELVNNLLFWAGSQLNGRVVSPVTIPLQEVVSDSIRYFERQASDKGIILKNELPPALSAWVDKTMIQVMIRNLISNAIKFCNPGDTISIKGKKMNGAVEICVEDTGIGMGEDVLKKITLKESITTYGTCNEKGTGLGLLLCREFAEANHGLFRVESAQGKGSQFYFTLPVSKDV